MAGHLLAPLLLAPLLLLLAISGSCASPQEDLEARLLQYREAAMESEGCSFWKDVMRLHYKVLLGLDNCDIVDTALRQHPSYCEAGIMGVVAEADDFQMAGIAWILNK